MEAMAVSVALVVSVVLAATALLCCSAGLTQAHGDVGTFEVLRRLVLESPRWPRSGPPRLSFP